MLNKPGPKPSLESSDLGFYVAYALGAGRSYKEIAAVAAISSSMVLRFATRAGFTTDPRCHEIVRFIHEQENAETKVKNQDDQLWDPGLDMLI
jgi:hypothetical protein